MKTGFIAQAQLINPKLAASPRCPQTCRKLKSGSFSECWYFGSRTVAYHRIHEWMKRDNENRITRDKLVAWKTLLNAKQCLTFWCLACVAGRRMGGKGPKGARKGRREGEKERPSSRTSRARFFPFPSPSTPATQAIWSLDLDWPQVFLFPSWRTVISNCFWNVLHGKIKTEVFSNTFYTQLLGFPQELLPSLHFKSYRHLRESLLNKVITFSSHIRVESCSVEQ